jgi:Domain of unknown function (DUF4145)
VVPERSDVYWIYCNRCKNRTRHILVGSKEYRYVEEDEPSEWGIYRMWSCAGCDACTLEDYYSADYMPDENGEPVFDSVFSPKRAHLVRPARPFMLLPQKLNRLYREIITSHNENLPLLCSAGLRALVEGISADKGITGRNLEDKIEGMTTLLPKNIVANLHNFRFMGNKAVHELESPTEFEITLALNVIEDILNFLYDLDYKAKMLNDARASLESSVGRTQTGSNRSADKTAGKPAVPPSTKS